jgi:DNA-binding beta-propeller fold protein YncE
MMGNEVQSMDSSVVEIGVIETFAGNGKSRSTGDGKIATKAGMPLPVGLAVDVKGQFLYFVESGSDRVRRVDLATGIIGHVAGIGETCYSGDGGPAAEAGLYLPLDVAFDSKGDLYICDSGSNRIRRVDMKTGIIETVVGTDAFGFNGDGLALEVNLTYPSAIAFDSRDRLFIVDTQAHRIRLYDPETKHVTSIAGIWSREDDDRDSPLIAKNLVVLSGDAIGIDFSDDHGWLRPECLPESVDMNVYLDDGKLGPEVRFHDPVAIAVDGHGDAYVADKGSNRIRKIDMATGVVTTVAGKCFYGYDGDGKPAIHAMLNAPEAVLVDPAGHVYISDAMNHRVRRVEAGTGLITTVAGNGESGYKDSGNMGGCGMAKFIKAVDKEMIKHGDGRIAVEAVVNSPAGLALDPNGMLFISERGENKIRRLKLF